MAKILYAEDDEDLATMIVEWLNTESHKIDTVCTGAEALEFLEFNSYDILILDWNLPILDGLHVTKEVRLKDSQIPIILLTGSRERNVQALAKAAGATRVYLKPPDFDSLGKCIKELCICD